MWANQMEFVLRNFPSDRKQVIWDKWMKDYWEGRLHGKPCKLGSKEAGELLECALSLEPVFPSAVDLVLQGPSVSNRIDSVLFLLERGQLIQSHPAAVIRLLKWLLSNCQEDWLYGDEITKAIMQLPRHKSFIANLMVICEQLVRLGYTKGIELKAEIRQTFTLD